MFRDRDSKHYSVNAFFALIREKASVAMAKNSSTSRIASMFGILSPSSLTANRPVTSSKPKNTADTLTSFQTDSSAPPLTLAITLIASITAAMPRAALNIYTINSNFISKLC